MMEKIKIGVLIDNPVFYSTITGVDVDKVKAILFYTGCRPVSLNRNPTGKLLCMAVSGVSSNYYAGSIVTSGMCGYFRLVDGDDVSLFDGFVATSGGDIVLDNRDFQKGGIVHVNLNGGLFPGMQRHVDSSGKMFSWSCPRGCHGMVTWIHAYGDDVAKCDECGRTSQRSK